MARPPLVLETWGKIRRTTTPAGTDIAHAKYRDSDGRTRPMSRTGNSPADAERNLLKALRDRLTPSDGMKPSTRISELAEQWWEEWVAAEDRPIGTERRYRGVLDNHVIDSLGGLTVAEATVPRLDRFLKAKTKSAGYSTASIAKVLLSGMLDMALRHGAIKGGNPVQSTAPIPKPEKKPKAWTLEDIATIRRTLREWDSSKDRSGRTRVSDLADPSDFMLGTGCRPGETFALRWEDINFAASPPTARIRATVVRGDNYGLKIQERTKGKNVRVLKLPSFIVGMLVARRLQTISEVVFPSSTGTVRGPDNYRLQWHQALGDTPYLDELPKTFRSTVATHIAKTEGADKAKGQLGHSSVKITEDSYIEHDELAADVTDSLEAFNVLAPAQIQKDS